MVGKLQSHGVEVDILRFIINRYDPSHGKTKFLVKTDRSLAYHFRIDFHLGDASLFEGFDDSLQEILRNTFAPVFRVHRQLHDHCLRILVAANRNHVPEDFAVAVNDEEILQCRPVVVAIPTRRLATLNSLTTRRRSPS